MDISLKTTTRDKQGKAFRMANPDTIPGVVYGKEQEPLNVALDSVVLEKAFHNAGYNKIIDLHVEDMKKPVKVLFHDVQFDPVTNKIVHFDLYAVMMGQKMRAEIPVHIINDEHIGQLEGVMTTFKDTIEVESIPSDLPESIEVDVSNLKEIGDSIIVGDLKVGKNIEITDELDDLVVKINPLMEEIEEEEEEPMDAADVPSEQGGEAEEEGESKEPEGENKPAE